MRPPSSATWRSPPTCPSSRSRIARSSARCCRSRSTTTGHGEAGGGRRPGRRAGEALRRYRGQGPRPIQRSQFASLNNVGTPWTEQSWEDRSILRGDLAYYTTHLQDWSRPRRLAGTLVQVSRCVRRPMDADGLGCGPARSPGTRGDPAQGAGEEGRRRAATASSCIGRTTLMLRDHWRSSARWPTCSPRPRYDRDRVRPPSGSATAARRRSTATRASRVRGDFTSARWKVSSNHARSSCTSRPIGTTSRSRWTFYADNSHQIT